MKYFRIVKVWYLIEKNFIYIKVLINVLMIIVIMWII